jgi:hypothetical protein
MRYRIQPRHSEVRFASWETTMIYLGGLLDVLDYLAYRCIGSVLSILTDRPMCCRMLIVARHSFAKLYREA